jgi:hypothetical protein
MQRGDDLASSLKSLGTFLDRAPLTDTIACLEEALEGSTQAQVNGLLEDAGISSGLLRDAMTVRARIGRVSDVIHATAIALSLSTLLQPGEIVARPSLAAGNDKSRPFDLETNRRVAEFKLARWTGSDAMRKRQVFKDLVTLAAEESDRAAELYVLGTRPIRFLQTSRSTARWGLDRSLPTQKLFEERFGSLDVEIADFTGGPGAHVKVIDLEERMPRLFSDPLPTQAAGATNGATSPTDSSRSQPISTSRKPL